MAPHSEARNEDGPHSTDNVVPFAHEGRLRRQNVSASLLDRKQTEPIPDDAEIHQWWRMQADTRLLNWICDHLDPKLARRSIKLMIASQRCVPAGCLPDNDEILADAAGYGKDITTWVKVKDRVLADIWFKRPDGRWQCGALTEGILSKYRRQGNRPPTHRGRKSGPESAPHSHEQNRFADDDIEF